jgi:hypothetical protein
VRFEWDEAKNRLNRAKHGVSFETARFVFQDPLHLSVQNRHELGEERWVTIGIVDRVVLVVAHIYSEVDGDEAIRIISARRATRTERIRYEEGS